MIIILENQFYVALGVAVLHRKDKIILYKAILVTFQILGTKGKSTPPTPSVSLGVGGHIDPVLLNGIDQAENNIITLCLIVILHAFLSSTVYFKIIFFENNSFRNTFRVPNCLDPDQARLNVGPGLDPNLLTKAISRRHL